MNLLAKPIELNPTEEPISTIEPNKEIEYPTKKYLLDYYQGLRLNNKKKFIKYNGCSTNKYCKSNGCGCNNGASF